MAARPKHQNKDYEALFVEAEANGWVIEKSKKHFTCKCSCADKHIVTVGSTPSDFNPYRKTKTRLNACKGSLGS